MSPHRWCINVANEQAGCNATPVLLRILWRGRQTPRITDLFASGFKSSRHRNCRPACQQRNPLRVTMGINSSRQHVEAERLKVVAKLVD